ncbi:MAG TPA: PQQ-binding-like beta-propeller repeat protein [Vicinamibacterales bacterium]|nr:PQQ-binding-like beta-propeller repeat protein [Vicinamibacterales bacterium]
MKRLLLAGAVVGVALGAGLRAQNPTAPAKAPVKAAAPAKPAPPVKAPAPGDWPTVGNDPGGMKFSPLTQITPDNVTQLTQAWTYDMGVPAAGYTITPIVIGNVMYLPIQGTIVVALQADTGKELWKQDLKNLKDLGPNPSAGGRGISYWSGTARVQPRIVINTANGFMVQLDAKTGEPIPGPAGVINLATGVTEKFGGGYATNMPPALYKNIAIVAARTGEQGRYGLPGDPRAFDLLTGKEVWRFHIVPQPGDENFGTWGLNGWQDRRGPGVWVPMVVDPVNDLVLVPLGNATDQNYGGSRPGENLYATSLLVLQASTGKRKWHFQFTHHDIYDWDVSAPPALIEATKDGQKIPAVAQMTKQGLLFMFNRLTGEPLFGVEERPVPRFDAPGDQAWPTQPFPVKPAGVTRDGMTRKEVSRISPEAEKYCTELFDKSVNQGPYTPYGMVPSLVFPGSEGGGGWGGVSSNPALGLVFLNTRHLGVIAQLQPSMSSGVLPSFGKQKVPTNFYVDPQGYPCNAPPWSELMAVSTATGDIVWRTPLGEYPELKAKGILNTGTAVNDGGSIATASGLVFIGATTDFGFRAFDAKTGKELWKATLADDALMTPLTYQGGNGKQFVVTVAGGGDAAFHLPAKPTPGPNATVVAFSLK